MASTTVVHVRRFDVVCLPAKKKVLHSSTMSFTVMGLALPPLLLFALIMSPRRSLAHPPSLSSSAASCRRPMSVARFFLISLSSFHELVFFLVGKNL